MDCEQARDRLSEYQDGNLDAAAAASLAAHLRGCADCAGCVGSLLAVRELLRNMPPEPAPPELVARVLAAVEAEAGDSVASAPPGEAEAATPFLSRFRIPLEAAAAVLLFASVYWYQRTTLPAVRPPTGPSSVISSEAPKESHSGPAAAKEVAAVNPPSRPRLPRGVPKPPKGDAPAAGPRTWTEASLPSVPALRASTDSEPIVPISPSPGPEEASRAAGAPPSGKRRGPEGDADLLLSRVFAPRPSRLLRPVPYGRDIVVDVKPEDREGAEERIAEATFRFGGIVERIDRGSESTEKGPPGTVRAILPEIAAAGFLEELRRIGTVPSTGLSAATGVPAGPRPGTVAYAIRIRVR